MASGRISPPRRPFQAPPTLAPKTSDRLTVPKYHVVDPLLGNLSPESTLQALSSTDAVPSHEQAAHDILSTSIAQASSTERALGIRAALAAQNLGQWYREVRAWEWPKRPDAQVGKGFIPPPDAEESGYCGSLPTAVVQQHERRIEEIRDGMDSLDVEELKEHVLNAHIPGRSRPSSANSTMSVPPPLSYVQLSDFTAVITATILRALPLLSRLNALLSTWDVRLLVIKQIPGLLLSLKFARSELNSALDLLKSSVPPTESDVLYSSSNYHAKRATLESTVLSAGRRTDRILDSLDGREDSLPENWIDDLETIEADFASWVMQAEKQTLENEWRRLSARSGENDKPQPDITEQDMPENKFLAENSAEAAKISPVGSPSGEPPSQVNAVIAPEPELELEPESELEPELQTRPAVLQVGRTAPMETIAEEIGSPYDRSPSRNARGIDDASVIEARSVPESPSPLPSDPVTKGGSLESVQAIQLDAGTDVPGSADITTAGIPQDIADLDANILPYSVDGSPAQQLVHVPELNRPLSLRSNEQQSVLERDEKQSPSPVDVTATEETVSLPKESKDSFEHMNMEPPVRSDAPENETFQSFNVVSTDESRPQSTNPDSNRLTDSSPEELVGSLADSNLLSTTTRSEESGQIEAKSLASPDITSTNIPGIDLVRVQPEAQETESSAQLSPAEQSPPAEDSPSKTDAKINSPPSQASTASEPISEIAVASSMGSESSKAGEEFEPIAEPVAEPIAEPVAEPITEPVAEPVVTEYSPHPEHDGASSDSKELQPIIENDHPKPSPADNEIVATDNIATKTSPGPDTPRSTERCVTPSNDNVAALPNLFVPNDNSKIPTEQHEPEESDRDENKTPKRPLESPIKLSKTRPGRLDLDKQKQKSRVRRTSNASDGSVSDYPSLVSSPEIPEPRTSSSNATPLLLETPPHFPADYRPSKPARQSNGHSLREDRLFHLDAEKPSPRDAFAHNRTLSLPLQRFINESLDVNYDTGSGNEEDSSAARVAGHQKSTPTERRRKSKSASSTSDMERSQGQERVTTRRDSSGPDSDASVEAQPKSQKYKEISPKTRVEPLSNTTTARLKKRLTAHPSLESIGPYKSNTQTGHSRPALGKAKSRSSSINKGLIRPKDQMDVKINSILTSLPGHIHLVPADQDDDAISVASSVPFRRERFRSDSPQGTPSRSFTPTPSLSLRPTAGRRRHSHAPEESSVKLYHLHRGGKSAPTKLFVRTVGENGERVMVRVGGGWADLAEYLREYAIHHGRRHVSETPRVEVEGLSSRDSPSYSPPASRVPSGNARNMPARPGSVISNRPSSSLAVRKTRRSSNVSDIADIRTASAGDALNVSFSPGSNAFGSRRLSVSSNVSAGAMSSVSEARHGSPGAPAMPLGLAGPKPRAKRAAITPEGEAWVEDVLGQARRSTSLRPFKYTLPAVDNEGDENTPTLPKSRSISDISKAGSSKRVILRGLR